MRMRRWFALFSLFSLLSILTISAPATSGQQASIGGPRVLQVIDSEPLPGQELGLRTPITVYFDRELNCDTVSAAVQITPQIVGQFSCEGNLLTFTPDVDYERATTYTLILQESLLGADGAQLVAPVDLTFDSQGFLQVMETFPAANASVAPDTRITVIFNRPVVPLGIVEDTAELSSPLTISPSAAGSGEWLNTSIYVFTPDEGLAAATTYTIQVDPALVASDGAVLSDAYSWQFTTLTPVIEEYVPSVNAGSVPLDTDVQLQFSQPMDQASVEANFFLRPVPSADGGRVAGSFDWSEDGARMRFVPDDLLTIDTLYEVGFDVAPLAASGGQMTFDAAPTWNFVTVPLPEIVQTDPRDNTEDAPPYGGFTLYFASEMEVDTLADKITISPEPRREPEFYWRDWENAYSVSFPTEPSTNYTITIAPGMADVYGNTIDAPYRFGYRTSPYSPELTFQTPGRIGFYNAYRAPTQLFVTHRNVERLDVELHTMPLDTLTRFLLDEDRYDPASAYSPQASDLLRSWTVESIAPENALRYELLNLGAGSVNAQAACPNAMPSRMSVGDLAIVITESGPLRARSVPGEGEIVELLYRDYQMSIVGGPVCTGGNLLWWEIELRDGTTAWVAEGLDDEYFIEVSEPGQTTAINVAADDEGRLAPGVYWLSVQAPEMAARSWEPQRHVLVVSTAVLTMKSAIDSVTVWATDVQSGEPIANAPIVVYDTDYNVIAEGMTDADGLLSMAVPREVDLYMPRVAVLQTADAFGMAYTDWTNGLDPWMFGQSADFFPRRYRLYAYTDRPVYRPGQPVYFRGVLRDKDDVTYTLPDRQTVPVEIRDGSGEIVYQRDLPLTPFGTFSGQLDLAPDASLGNYYLSVELPSNLEYQSEGGGVSFAVAEYRLPEFSVELSPAQPEVVQGDTVAVAIDSRYFFGGAVSNATVSYNVIANPYFFSPDLDGPSRYDFIDFNADAGPGEFYGTSSGQIASGEATTDADGQFVIEVPAELEDASQSQTFTIEAVVTDESNQSVAGRTEVIVHQGAVYIGVRPESYVGVAGEEAALELISVDWEGDTVPNQPVEIEIFERRWSSVQERDELGRTTWMWEVEEVPVSEGSVTTNADGMARYVFTPPYGGVYKATVTSQDERGNRVMASTTLWVSDREYVSWRQQNSNRIDLIADRENYEIGDVAEILITSPFQGEAEALITVERGDVLQVERVTMESNSLIYRLPITEDFAPNIYVGAMIVKGVDENNPVAGFRAGYVQLGVEIERKELNVEISSDVERAEPQQTVTYTVAVTDYAGDPVDAEVGVGLTDLAALSLAAPNSGPLLNFFYGDQSLGVRTSSPLTINVDQITQETLDTVKGGGGGGLGDGLIEVRGEFVDTPYWNPSIVTGPDGRAEFEVRLPDNLTTWRLDARAVTSGADGETLVGQDTFDLLSTKPLLIRPVTPRFFVVDDEVLLAAVVNNNTERDQTVTVTLESSGVDVADSTVQTVDVPAGGRARVTWEVNVNPVEVVTLAFTAQAGEFSDGSISPVSLDDSGALPVYRYEVPETAGTAGVLRSDDTRVESIVLPRRFEVTQGELRVQMDYSLASAVLDGLAALDDQLDRSIESTISRFLPAVAILRTLDGAGLADDALRADVEMTVSMGLQKLYSEQKADGGWSWFVRSSRSDPLVTAYALIGLAEAQAAGYPVSEDVIDRAQGYLNMQFVVAGPSVERWRLDRQTLILYALAKSGAPDVARTVNMYDNRQFLRLYSKALLAQTIHLINPDDRARLDALANELVSASIASATGVYWQEDNRDRFNWNTDTRTSAIVLRTLIQLRPDSDLLPNAVRHLMVQRQADTWETRHETAWVLLVLADWLAQSGELQPDYRYAVDLNGEQLAEAEITPDNVREGQQLLIDVSELLRSEANRLAFTWEGEAGALYYTAHLRAYLPVPEVEPLNRGIIIQRTYNLIDDAEQTPITSAQVGQVVQVRLTVIAPNDLHYVVIEDPLPAGADAINPDLEIAQQIGTRPELDASDPLSYGWGWWYFSQIEFRDEKVVMYSDYLPAGTYEYVYALQPGLEGTYNVIPPIGYEAYFPEVYGRGAGSIFRVLPAEE